MSADDDLNAPINGSPLDIEVTIEVTHVNAPSRKLKTKWMYYPIDIAVETTTEPAHDIS